MRGSPDIASRTDARTHRCMHEHESIGHSANAERSKINKKSSTVWKKIAKISPKPYIMLPQAMYFWPKNSQNSQNKNFHRRNTTIKWFKATVPSFWPSFRQIWCADSKKMSENMIFERKWPNFGPKKGPKWPWFFYQNKNCHWPFLNNKLSSNNKN